MSTPEQENSEIISRLRVYANDRFGSMRKMSLEIGRSENFFTSMANSNRVPDAHILRVLEQDYGLDVHWLMTGEKGTNNALASEPRLEYLPQVIPAQAPMDVEGCYESVRILGGLPMYSELTPRQKERALYHINLYRLHAEALREEYESGMRRERTSLAEKLLNDVYQNEEIADVKD